VAATVAQADTMDGAPVAASVKKRQSATSSFVRSVGGALAPFDFCADCRAQAILELVEESDL
jgi:hypothetical protein